MHRDYTGHEAEMRALEEKRVICPMLIASIKKEMEEARKEHPSKSEIWELFSDEAKQEMIDQFEKENNN